MAIHRNEQVRATNMYSYLVAIPLLTRDSVSKIVRIEHDSTFGETALRRNYSGSIQRPGYVPVQAPLLNDIQYKVLLIFLLFLGQATVPT